MPFHQQIQFDKDRDRCINQHNSLIEDIQARNLISTSKTDEQLEQTRQRLEEDIKRLQAMIHTAHERKFQASEYTLTQIERESQEQLQRLHVIKKNKALEEAENNNDDEDETKR